MPVALLLAFLRRGGRQIARSGAADEPALLREARAVAGAVPGVLLRVPFERTAMCGQRGRVGVSRLTAASRPLMSSCGFIMLREGVKSSAHGLLLPSTRSRRMVAAAMERVMPHLPMPVAT